MRSQNLENLPNDYKELTSYQFEQMPLQIMQNVYPTS